MKIVKMIALLLAALFALSACQAKEVVPEVTEIPEVQEVLDMAGIVTEITDDYVMISTETQGEVQVNVSENTVYEGEKPAVGDYIHVTYNGMMTRSLPPQIHADRIGCYVRTGVVNSVSEDSFMLGLELEEIQVNAPAELLEGVEEGMQVTVYFNGAMTMSLPAQVGAEHIVIR